MREIEIKEIAYGRAGDKGNKNDITLTPYRGEDYPLLLENVTVEKVGRVYGEVVDGSIERYELPGLKALNIVLHGSIRHGVSSSLNIDTHRKAMAEPLLDATIQVSDDYEPPPVINGEKEWSR